MGLRHSAAERLVGRIVAFGFAVFAIFPVLWTLATSLKTERDVLARRLGLLPAPPTLANYVAIWTQSGLPTLMRNSAVVTMFTVLICVGVGTFAAYAVSRTRFRGRRAVLLVFLLVRAFPVVLLVVPLFLILRRVGLLDTRIGLALAYTGFLLPIFVWTMKGFFDAVPPELEEAARIDGCTRFGALWRVVLPLVRGGLFALRGVRGDRGMERVPVRAHADHECRLAHLAGRFAAHGGRVPAALGRAERRRHPQHPAGAGAVRAGAAHDCPRARGGGR